MKFHVIAMIIQYADDGVFSFRILLDKMALSSNQIHIFVCWLQYVKARFTFGADSSQVCDFHQHAGEHVRLVWASATGVYFQRL